MQSVLSFTLRESGRRTIHAVTTFTNASSIPSCNKCNLQITGSVLKRFFGQKSFNRSYTSLHRKSDGVTLFNTLQSTSRSACLFSPGRSVSTSTSKRGNEKPKESEDEVLHNLRKLQQRQKRLLEEPDVDEPHVIYKGLLTEQMRRLKLFSLTTSGMGLLMQPILIEKASENGLVANVAAFGMVGFFTFVTPLLIHLIAKKYVTEIVYDPVKDIYTATTYTFFLRKKEITFSIDGLKVPDVPGPFTAITVNSGEDKNVPLFVAPESFLKPSHYGRFMRYDKPIDLHLTVNSTENDAERKPKS